MQFYILMGISVIIWIYVVFMVWKKKTNIFHNQIEPRLAERRLKWLKAFLLLAGLSLTAYIGFMLHIVLFRGQDYEGGFFIALFSILFFLLGLVGSLVIFLLGQGKTTKEIPK